MRISSYSIQWHPYCVLLPYFHNHDIVIFALNILYSYLLNVPNGKEPLKQFLLHIIFNAALWIKAKKNVSCFSVSACT